MKRKHEIVPITAAQGAGVLRLNAQFVAETGSLTALELDALIAQAMYARCIGDGADAFLIAIGPRQAYQSPNYLYFSGRFARFAYVDRIIVSPALQGAGAARALYEDLAHVAMEQGLERIVCEVNIEPPNPRSHAFHESMGFAPLEERCLPSGKTVRYYVKAL